jgi:cytochrome c biogenesis protein CcmG, thiol:disulfide interchange protein DsbE
MFNFPVIPKINPRHLIQCAVMICGTLVASLSPVHALETNMAAPEFELPTDNTTLKLAQYKGKVVYLDFWASWCGPCRQSFPWMNDIQQRFGGQGLHVIAVNLDTHPEDAKKFLAQTPHNLRWPMTRKA